MAKAKVGGGEGMRLVTAWLPQDLVDKLDAEAKRMAAKVPGLKLTRSDAVRALLTEALKVRR